jgi:uncharacterized membrane protein YczE
VRFIRNCIEVAVLVIGYFLGGFVGFGTILVALTIGYFVQFVFKLFGFNVKEVAHRYVEDDIRYVKELLSGTVDKNM